MVTQEELTKAILENKTKLFGLAYSITKNLHDAEDALGETILIAFNKRNSIRKKESIGAWLYSVVNNEAYGVMRRKTRIELVSNVIDIKSEENIEDISVENMYLWEHIFKLPDEYRNIVYLYYINDFSIKQIHKILDIPVGTVKSRLFQARELLRKLLGEGDSLAI